MKLAISNMADCSKQSFFSDNFKDKPERNICLRTKFKVFEKTKSACPHKGADNDICQQPAIAVTVCLLAVTAGLCGCNELKIHEISHKSRVFK